MNREQFSPVEGVKDPLAMTNFRLMSRVSRSLWSALASIVNAIQAIIPPAILGGGRIYDIRAFSDLAHALSVIGSQVATLVITQETAMTANTTTPATLGIKVLKGGSFAISSGVALTVSGSFEAGIYQVFSGAGTVTFGVISTVSPEWWGAVTGGTDDCAAALRAAIASVLALGGTVLLQNKKYRFNTQITVDTSASGSVVTIRGEDDWRSDLAYYGSQSLALKLGDSGIGNSGFVNLVNVHISGGNSTGEVNGVEIHNCQRYTRWDNVRVRGFSKGLGLKCSGIWSTDWGKVHIESCYQGVDFGANAFSMKGLHVENCGPWSTYTHSTIALTDPCVSLGGNGFDVITCETEGILAINVLEISGQTRVLGWYIEGNEPHSTGNEAILKGRGPVLIGQGYTGVYPSAPNPRYIISLGDSVDAYVRFSYLPNAAPDQTNTAYGVDFGTSKGADVHIDYWNYENLSQETARNQGFKGNLSNFTFNGRRYAAGMPVEALGRTLLENYNAIGIETGLMQKPSSILTALGFTASNLSADSVLKKFPSPLGSGRVQKIERSAVTEAGIYQRFAAGVLSSTDKYFFSSYIHRASASGTASLRVLQGASDSIWQPLVTNWVGWQRVSNIRVIENAGTGNVDIWPCYISSGAVHHTCGLVMINLTQFDTDHGTSLASMTVEALESIIDLRLASHLFREYARNAVPTDGAYNIGNQVWYFPLNAGGRQGAECITDGTPGTWREFGDSGQGATVASANDMTVDGTSAIISGSTQINRLVHGGQLQSGYRLAMEFSGAPLIKHNQAAGSGFYPILLEGAVDFQAAAGSVLHVVFNGSSWQEISRKNPAAVAGSFTTVAASGYLSRSSVTGITASTTQTQGQQALTKDINVISTCANANDVVTLPAAVAGMVIYIRNNGAQTLQIFPASGDAINGAAADASATLAASASVTYRTANTAGWYS